MLEQIIENAKEIMFLCFGAGFLGLATYVSVTLRRVSRLLKKVDTLTDVFTGYVAKPLQMINSFEKQVDKWINK